MNPLKRRKLYRAGLLSPDAGKSPAKRAPAAPAKEATPSKAPGRASRLREAFMSKESS